MLARSINEPLNLLWGRDNDIFGGLLVQRWLCVTTDENKSLTLILCTIGDS